MGIKLGLGTEDFIKIVEEKTQNDFLQVVIDQAPIVLFAADPDGVVTLSRGKALKALGFSQDELVGQSIYDLYQNEPGVADSTRRALQGEDVRVLLRLDGCVHETWFSSVIDNAGDVQGLVGVSTDVTHRFLLEEKLHRNAFYDQTTNLPNLNMLLERVESAMNSDRVQPLVLTKISITHFHEIYSTYGFRFGEDILRQIANRLDQLFLQESVVAWTGADEFAVLVPGSTSRQRIDEIADCILGSFKESFIVENIGIGLEVTIGSAIFPGHADTPETLLRCALSAMQNAKDRGSLHEIYNPAGEKARRSNVAMLADLRNSIGSEQLFLHYQPKVCMHSGALAGVEALLRWNHPEKGFIPPADFIPLAESTGVIAPISKWIANTAASHIVRWQKQGHSVKVAINFSARSFQNLSIVEQFQSLLEVWGIKGEQLELEITETAVMADAQRAIDICRGLRQLGVSLAIDDFGVGHSPLAYLKDLNVTHIKIDQSFVKDMLSNEVHHIIVRSIINLARELNISTIAEGVEDRATYECLAGLGCDQAQAYFISRPLPEHELSVWLDKHNTQIAR